jgi:hypothetical protein
MLQLIIHLLFTDLHQRMFIRKKTILFYFVFFLRQLEEAQRLTRRMDDCFSFEIIDMTTTHVILPEDDPQMILTLDLFLVFISGWFIFLPGIILVLKLVKY